MFEIFYKALKGKQVLVFSGLFKDAHKMYKLGELDIYKKQSDIEYVYKLYYNWCKNEYENIRCIELTEEEKKKINKKATIIIVAVVVAIAIVAGVIALVVWAIIAIVHAVSGNAALGLLY